MHLILNTRGCSHLGPGGGNLNGPIFKSSNMPGGCPGEKVDVEVLN